MLLLNQPGLQSSDFGFRVAGNGRAGPPVIRPEQASESPGGPPLTSLWKFSLRGLGWGSRIRISVAFPGGADAAGLTTFEDHWERCGRELPT